MKLLIYRFLLLGCLVCAAGLVWTEVPAQAQETYTTQLEERRLPVKEFSSVSVSDDFDVTLAKGAYGVRITTDKVLAPYVQVYVRSKTLYVTYDEKSVPKDVKKMFKGRKAPDPVFRVVVFLPELNGIYLSENAVLTASDDFIGSHFEMELADKAVVKSLTLRASEINVHLKKNSQATMTLSADKKMNLNVENNANLKVSGNAELVSVVSSNSASVTLAGHCKRAVFTAAGSSKVTVSEQAQESVEAHLAGSAELQLSGEAPVLLIRAEKNAELEANSLKVKKVDAQMSGSSKAEVNVSEDIDATLTGGSELYFTGTPQFRIGKIVKSTLAPLGSSSK